MFIIPIYLFSEIFPGVSRGPICSSCTRAHSPVWPPLLLYQYCSSLYCRRLQMSRWLFLPACFGTATTSLRETSRQGKASTGRGLTLPASSYRASYLATFCSPILHSERRLCLHQLLQGYKSGDRPEPSRLTGRGLLWCGSGVSS